MYPECVIAFWDTLLFSFGCIEYTVEQRVQLDAKKKKSNIYANHKQKENMQMACFTRKLNIRISHNGEMIEFVEAVIFWIFVGE